MESPQYAGFRAHALRLSADERIADVRPRVPVARLTVVADATHEAAATVSDTAISGAYLNDEAQAGKTTGSVSLRS